ncbi:MAG: hypothetical protein ACTSPO_15230 [Candidatus Heimdallarchaeaceae archaeon]
MLLDTVNLTDQGNQRFTEKWQVPADPSGEGFYVVITTRVYTDSGYTTESALYSVNQEEFLVQKRYNPVYGGGGGEIDYKKVRKIVQDEIKRIPEVKIPSVKFPKPEKVDINSVLRAIKNIHIPEQEKIDLSPVLNAIQDIYIPKPEKVDYSRISGELQKISDLVNKLSKSSGSALNKELEEVRKIIDEKIEELRKDLKRPVNIQFPTGMVEESKENKRKFL